MEMSSWLPSASRLWVSTKTLNFGNPKLTIGPLMTEHVWPAIGNPMGDLIEKKKRERKEEFTLFSDHNESLLRRQPEMGGLIQMLPDFRIKPFISCMISRTKSVTTVSHDALDVVMAGAAIMSVASLMQLCT